MSRKKIAVIDFDGTIAEHKFPRIGKAMPQAFEVMKELQDEGWVLVLWTCRENEGSNISKQYLREAVEFCKDNGIEFDGINETPKEFEFRSEKGLNRKAYGDVYIDDRNLGGFPGWKAVRKELIGG